MQFHSDSNIFVKVQAQTDNKTANEIESGIHFDNKDVSVLMIGNHNNNDP